MASSTEQDWIVTEDDAIRHSPNPNESSSIGLLSNDDLGGFSIAYGDFAAYRTAGRGHDTSVRNLPKNPRCHVVFPSGKIIAGF